MINIFVAADCHASHFVRKRHEPCLNEENEQIFVDLFDQ